MRYCAVLSNRTVATPFPPAALCLRHCFSNGKTWCLKEWNQCRQERGGEAGKNYRNPTVQKWGKVFIHSVFCLTTGPKPPPKRFLHIVRSRASSFKWQYPLLSLRSSSSFLRLLPRLLVTSISLFIFPSITCFRRQFLRKMWPIQLAFRFLISCRIFFCSLTLTLLHFSHDRSNWSSPLEDLNTVEWNQTRSCAVRTLTQW